MSESSIINNDLYASAAAGLTELNGMYIFYGAELGATPEPGATIAALSCAVASTGGAGMARCHGLVSAISSGAVFSATVVSGGVTSGGIIPNGGTPDSILSGGSVLSSVLISGTIKYVTTTANAEIIAGVRLTPGITVNAVGVAHLTPNAYNKGGIVCSSGCLEDKILDYSVVSGGITVPAGGYVTLVDNITVSGTSI